LRSKAGRWGWEPIIREVTLQQSSSRTREAVRFHHVDLCLIIRYTVIQLIRHEGIMESAKVGKRGAIVVPVKLRKRFGLEEGSMVTAEETEDGILFRPAVLVPVERYTAERKAEFLLSTATSQADYRKARKEVRKLGLDPDSVPHRRPA